MNDLQKILWNEGLFLTPHHLQQTDRYHETLLKSSLRGYFPLGHGLNEVKLAVDAEGNLSVARLVGMLPDGTAVSVPDIDRPPGNRAIGPAFDPNKPRLGVYLALPNARPGRRSVSPEGVVEGQQTRYRQMRVTIADETGSSAALEREVVVSPKNLRLIFEGEPNDEHTLLKIAELKRSATGTFIADDEFLPPLLFCSASPWLLALVERVIGQLSQRSDTLSKQRQQNVKGLAQFTTSEAANFLFLHTVNGFIPTLSFMYRQSRVHPAALYLELGRLIGQLATFASDIRPSDVPPYNHDDLSGTFSGIDKHLRALLETVITARYRTITLTRKGAWQTAQLIDEDIADQLVLGVAANVREEKIVNEMPAKAKISSKDQVNSLIAAALPGVTLKFLPAAPSAIPTQPTWKYFSFERAGAHWEAVKKARDLAIYIPPEFTELKLELYAVKEG